MLTPVTAAITALSLAVGGPATAAAPMQEPPSVWCYSCVVLAAGPAADRQTVLVHIHDPENKFPDAWFDGKKSPDLILATALAAITFRKKVNVNLIGTETNSLIDRIYVLQS